MSANSKGKILAYVNAYDRNVTGSNFFVTAKWPDNYEVHFIVDCGQFFGKETPLNKSFPYKASTVDLAFLTHVHIDHCGRFPKLIHDGFTGPIYATKGSSLLYPNAIINSSNIVIANCKHLNENPGFDLTDVEESIKNIANHQKDYDIEYEYKGRIRFRFIRNCHLFGASSILITLVDPNEDIDDVVLFFTGDYNDKSLFLPNYEVPDYAKKTEISAYFTESTYGNSVSSEVEYRFDNYLTRAIEEFKTTLFFAFSLGRAQDFLYLLKRAQESGKLPVNIPIYLDGSLTISDTWLVRNNPEILGIREDAIDFIPANFNILNRDSRKFIMSNHSKKIIVTSSGMGTFGPAREYIASLLDDAKVFMVFGGYCTEDSLGRSLMNIEQGGEAKVFGQTIPKQAMVCYLEELSGHARADSLVRYLQNFNVKSVAINHGEPEEQESLKERIDREAHPPKGVYIMSRNYTFRVTNYGIDKCFSSVPNEI